MSRKNIALLLGAVVIIVVVIIVILKNETPNNSPIPVAANPSPTTTYTVVDVATHNSKTSCWTAINGDVYDVTTWITQHPGGQRAILSLCGTDGSAAFNGQHGGQARPAAELASFKIGTLAQ